MESKSTLRHCVISNIFKEAKEVIFQLFQIYVLCIFLLVPKNKKNAENKFCNSFNKHFKEVEFTK